MTRFSLTRAWCVGAVVWLSMASTAFAFPTYPSLLPNTATAFSMQENMDRPCITCHNNADGGAGCVGRTIPAPSNACGTGPEPLLDTAPCLNAFGRMFRDAPLSGMVSKQWTLALANADADCDGFTNGQELQDPTGLWQFGPPPGNPAYVTRPGFATNNPGTNDMDGDDHCWIGRDLNADGDCTDAGEAAAGFDCDDASNTVNSSATEQCDDNIDNDCDGRVSLADDDCASVADRDGDGYCPTGRDLNDDGDCLDEGEVQSQVDCNDARVTVYPGAPEDCFDGLDNNCNGDIDLADAACDFNDRDGDGFCPVGQDFDGNGSCNDSDAERNAVPSDCNDSATDVNPTATEICTDRLDNDCDQQADLADSDCAHLVDADEDGFCPAGRDLNRNGNCTDDGELDAVVFDCDDLNYRRRPGIEDCTDPLDNDCDGLADVDDTDCADYLDHDDDGYCVAGQDLSQPRDRDCMDAELGETALFSDCDDTNALVYPQTMEAICDDGIDNNCNGVTDARDGDCLAFADRDGDGYCAAGIDNNGDGDCTDPDESGVAEDCDDSSAARSPGLTENCYDVTAAGETIDNDCNGLANRNDPVCQGSQLDRDGDGYCPTGIDLNDDGDCNDSGEPNNSNRFDCDDRDPLINTGVSEADVTACTDARDNNCTGGVDLADPGCALFLDQDEDSFCPLGRDLDFDGNCLGSGERDLSMDCDDDNANVNPRRLEVCTDGLDNDCDGNTDYYDFPTCRCATQADCEPAVVDACFDYACGSNGCTATRMLACEDAGVEPMPDAGPSDGGDQTDAGDAGEVTRAPKSSGCWLSVPGASSAMAWWWLIALGAGLWTRRGRGARLRSRNREEM